MLRGIFVTGTDTGVGKTVVSAALLHRYRGRAPSLRYWKPVQTGIEQDDDTAEVKRLTGCDDEDVLPEGVRLPNPVSPHLAARLKGVTIDVGDLRAVLAAQPRADWIVEGAGGVLVPLNDGDVMADLMRALGLPVVVVTRSTLGTINHTLLTLEAIRARSVRVAGVVMIGPPDSENRAAIERHGRVTVIGELPPLHPLTRDTLSAWATRALDVGGALEEHLNVTR